MQDCESCMLLYCIVLHCIALHCIVLHCIVLYCIVLYCIVLYCIVLYCVVLCCIVLYCIVLYCIVLYCIVLYCIVLYCIVLHDVPGKVSNGSVSIEAKALVGNGDLMRSTMFLIWKVGVRNPEPVDVMRWDVDRSVDFGVELQTGIDPRLAEVKVDGELL